MNGRTACAISAYWRAVLGVDKTVVERVEFDAVSEVVVAHVRPTARARGRCGVCRRGCPRYDGAEGLNRPGVSGDSGLSRVRRSRVLDSRPR